MSGKLLVINPGPKKKRRRGRMPPALAAYWSKKRGKKRAATNPRRKSRARRNPRLTQLFSRASLRTNVLDPVIAAGIGGAAAVALDVGMAYLPLPESWKSSALAQNAVKLAGAIALGFGAGKVLGRERGRLVTTGALTVAAYGLIRDTIKQVLPEDLRAQVKGLGGLTDYTDYDYAGGVGALEYQRSNLNLGVIEQDAASLSGPFADPFQNPFE